MSVTIGRTIAFHNNIEVKEKCLIYVNNNSIAEGLKSGKYWLDSTKKWPEGMSKHTDSHMYFENEFGIPSQLVFMGDAILDGLPIEMSLIWPNRFFDAIRVGVDLSDVYREFLIWILIDPVDGVIHFADNNQQRDVILNTANTHIKALTEDVSKEEWLSVRQNAWKILEDLKGVDKKSSNYNYQAINAVRLATWFGAWSVSRNLTRDVQRHQVMSSLSQIV